MNSKFIPILVFALWSIFCWRWYVCGIKQQCGTTATPASKAIEAMPTTPAIDTSEAMNVNKDAPSSAAAAAASKVQKEVSADIESAQVVEVKDHVLIHFPYGSTRRTDDDAIDAYLSDLANALKSSGGSVSLIGHTDGIGDAASNKVMSLQRAKHIKATLVKKGVNPARISVKGLGESRPIGSNDNPRGRYLNRRVEVRIK